MSIEGYPKIDRELSAYGEAVEAFYAYCELPHGKSVIRTFNTKGDAVRQADLTELFGLMDQGELTFDDLAHLYSMIVESVSRHLRRVLDSGKATISFSYFKSFFSSQLLRIIDISEAKARREGYASPGLLCIYERLRRLYEQRPDFVKKIIDAAVDDVPIKLEMEDTLRSVKGVMGYGDAPVTDHVIPGEVDTGIDTDGDAQYDA